MSCASLLLPDSLRDSGQQIMRPGAQRLQAQLVGAQQGALQFLAGMGGVVALHHGFRQETEHSTERYFSPRSSACCISGRRLAMASGPLLLDFHLGQIDLRDQHALRFLAAGGGLQCLRIRRVRRFEISAIEGLVSLESQGLGHHAVVLQLARQAEALRPGDFSPRPAPGENERLAHPPSISAIQKVLSFRSRKVFSASCLELTAAPKRPW